jgi:hypothetical protein
MAKKRKTEEQIIAILREAEDIPANEEFLRKHVSPNRPFIDGRSRTGT